MKGVSVITSTELEEHIKYLEEQRDFTITMLETEFNEETIHKLTGKLAFINQEIGNLKGLLEDEK
ncbi:hypothetical protein [Halobacillus karajensis]|uniref:hypothetical protein n=1 Tax=Halobacillus karajensis TaxID=195088 RepID=UPI00045CF0DB|nr:hypothetical protein [Halobacillus karajensis]CDQ21733.1 hypothetical protein BN982_04142 [Halobacillus karajensis]